MKTIYRIQAADGTYLQNVKWGRPRFGGRADRNFTSSSALSNHITCLTPADRRVYDEHGACVVQLQVVEQPVRMFGIDAWKKGMNERREKRNGR